MSMTRETDPRDVAGSGENFEADPASHPSSAIGDRLREALAKIPGVTNEEMRALEENAADQIGQLAEEVRVRVEATMDEKLNALSELIAGGGGTFRAFIFGAIFGVAVFVLAAVIVVALLHALRT